MGDGVKGIDTILIIVHYYYVCSILTVLVLLFYIRYKNRIMDGVLFVSFYYSGRSSDRDFNTG